MVTITRHFGGVTLNQARETLLGNANKPMLFENAEQAKSFLLRRGWTLEEMESLEFPEEGTAR